MYQKRKNKKHRKGGTGHHNEQGPLDTVYIGRKNGRRKGDGNGKTSGPDTVYWLDEILIRRQRTQWNMSFHKTENKKNKKI
jgi:hypothetical protein